MFVFLFALEEDGLPGYSALKGPGSPSQRGRGSCQHRIRRCWQGSKDAEGMRVPGRHLCRGWPQNHPTHGCTEQHRAAAGPWGLSALSQGFPNFPVPLPDETVPPSILRNVSHLGTESTAAAFPRASASAKSRPTGHGKLTESKRGGGKAKPIRQLT